MKIAIVLIAGIFLFSCQKEKHFDGPNNFSEDFSAYTTIEDIIDGNNEQWSFFQKTFEGNTTSIDTVIFHSSGKSFKSHAVPSTAEKGASKASINKQFMAFWEGETVGIEAWYYIEGTASAQWMFLFDLEEKTSIGAGPGMRLALVNNQLLVEHKYPNPNINQIDGSEIDFPRDQWVKIRFETKLSQKKKGYVKVWQDDHLIIEQNDWQTLPKDILYFQQGTKGMYSQIEFGVTANSSDNPMTVYVDDIDVRLVE
jgi:hypothetical protein